MEMSPKNRANSESSRKYLSLASALFGETGINISLAIRNSTKWRAKRLKAHVCISKQANAKMLNKASLKCVLVAALNRNGMSAMRAHLSGCACAGHMLSASRSAACRAASCPYRHQPPSSGGNTKRPVNEAMACRPLFCSSLSGLRGSVKTSCACRGERKPPLKLYHKPPLYLHGSPAIRVCVARRVFCKIS